MKRLKTFLIATALVMLTFSLAACGGDSDGTNGDNGDTVGGGGVIGDGGSGTSGCSDTTKILVAYFLLLII